MACDEHATWPQSWPPTAAATHTGTTTDTKGVNDPHPKVRRHREQAPGVVHALSSAPVVLARSLRTARIAVRSGRFTRIEPHSASRRRGQPACRGLSPIVAPLGRADQRRDRQVRRPQARICWRGPCSSRSCSDFARADPPPTSSMRRMTRWRAIHLAARATAYHEQMLFRSVVLGLGLIVVTPTGIVHAQPEATTKWCAPPRDPEPLLADARRHASSDALEAQVFRTVNQLPVLGEDAVSLVVDETVCKRAADAYRRWHLREMPDWPLRPVVVVRVGPLLMVDDQRTRTGRSATWAVLVFDEQFNERPRPFRCRLLTGGHREGTTALRPSHAQLRRLARGATPPRRAATGAGTDASAARTPPSSAPAAACPAASATTG